jgi:murein DD-endopeptidase MepM/ murein hydrolase activator NlpD
LGENRERKKQGGREWTIFFVFHSRQKAIRVSLSNFHLFLLMFFFISFLLSTSFLPSTFLQKQRMRENYLGWRQKIEWLKQNKEEIQRVVSRLPQKQKELREILTFPSPPLKMNLISKIEGGVGGEERISPRKVSYFFVRKKSKKIIARFKEIKKRLTFQEKFLKAIPTIWPVEGKITAHLGFSKNPASHRGVDILAPPGTPIRAPADGIVLLSRHNKTDLGNYIKISHGWGFTTLYTHNKMNIVKAGERVKKGQIIAYVGQTGQAKVPHLHYEVKYHHVFLDPAFYIAK